MCVVCMNCVTVCTYVVYLRMCMHTSCTCFTAHVYLCTSMYVQFCVRMYKINHIVCTTVTYIYIYVYVVLWGTLLNHLDVNAQNTCMIRMYIIYKHMQS